MEFVSRQQAGGLAVSEVATLSRVGAYTQAEAEDDTAAAIPSPSGTLAIGGSVSGSVGGLGSVFYAVNLVAGASYVFSTTASGSPGTVDPFLVIYDFAGVAIDFDDDSGGGLLASLSIDAQVTGTYYIEIFEIGSASSINFQINATQTGSPASGDAIAAGTSTSATLAVGATVAGNVDGAGDADWYQVSLTGGQSYLFGLTGGVLDPFLALYGADGSPITYNDDGGAGLSSALRFTPSTSGTYYIAAEGFGSSSGSYQLSLQAVAPQDPLDTLDLGTQLTSTNVRIYFANGGESFRGFTATRAWTPTEQAAAMAAAATWAVVTNVTFTQVATSAEATMVLVLDANLDSAGLMTTPPSLPNVGVFNTDLPFWTDQTLQPGGVAFQSIVHEIGHALGLAHPHDDGGGSQAMEGVTNEFDSYGSSGLNQGVYTVMSYNDGWPAGPVGPLTSLTTGSAGTPMALDIAAVQENYGAAAANTGDNTYDLASVEGVQFRAIWDTGGADGITYSGSTAGVIIDLRPATLTNTPGGGGFGSYVLGRQGGFFIAAGVVIENATGGGAADVLVGNSANNVLNGQGGADSLHGGAGDDTFMVDTAADLAFEGAGAGTDTAIATAGYYLWANVENLTLAAGSGSIFGVGNDLANLLTGNEGDNLLIAGGGVDTVVAGGGNDSIFGQDGDDTLQGGAGIDYLVGGTGDDLLLGEADADALYGEDGNDYLIGGSSFSTDILVGGEGNDFLDGFNFLGDFDMMDGGAGDDTYAVDTPDDLTFEAGGGGTDTVLANIIGAGYYLYPHVENLTLLANTPFGVGNDLNNILIGSEIGNYLLGGAGDDNLNGGAGNDVLFGEGGADTFVFEAGTGGDVIGDFQVGVDKIDLSDFATSFANLTMVQDGNLMAILLDGGDLVVLHNVLTTQLSASDFIF